MSSAVFSTSAATSRPFVFDEESRVCTRVSGEKNPADNETDFADSALLRGFPAAIKAPPAKIVGVTPASRLGVRPAPEMVSCGISAIDGLIGGLPRGCISEIFGPASSGRTTLLLSALAAATRRGEYSALVDASDALDPNSAFASGVDLNRLLWVRCSEECASQQGRALSRTPSRREAIPDASSTHRPSHAAEHRLEQVLRATDLLLESGGFGLIVLDLADLPLTAARLIPLASWFRFRRAIEHKPTILLVIAQQSIAGSCASLLLQLGEPNPLKATRERFPHTQLLTGLNIHARFFQSRIDRSAGRKPAHSIAFTAKTAWAG